MSDTSTSPDSTSESGPSSANPKRPWTILGRLSKAVREQNWFAVVLELGIVILGVVIGFQVTSWGQERADRVQETEYLHRLANNLRADTTALGVQIRSASEKRASARRILEIVDGPDPLRGIPPDSFVHMVSWVGRWGGAQFTQQTFDDLTSTGSMNLIQDPNLREQIQTYYDRVRWQEELQTHHKDWIWNGVLTLAIEVLPIDLQTPSLRDDISAISVSPSEAQAILDQLRELPRIAYHLKSAHRSYTILIHQSRRRQGEAEDLIQAVEGHLDP